MSFTDSSCELNDSLHAPHLTFDHCVEILLLYLREWQEVDRASITRLRILGDELLQALVQILRDERCI